MNAFRGGLLWLAPPALALLATVAIFPAIAAATEGKDCVDGRNALADGEVGRAIDLLTRCIDKGGLERTSLARTHQRRGNAYARNGDNDKALQDLNRAIELDPDLARAYSDRCWVNAATGRPEEALTDCDESLQLAPDNPATLDSRAFAHWLLDEHEKAREDLQRVRELDPSAPGWEDRFLEFEKMN